MAEKTYKGKEVVVTAKSNNSFSVEKFKSSFAKNGLATPTLFKCYISPVESLLEKYGGSVKEDLSIHIKKAQLPDLSLQTFQHSHNGIPTKYPYENQTGDLGIEVIASNNFWERNFFNDWQKLAISYGIPSPTSNNVGQSATFNVGYYDDFVSEVVIETFDTSRQIKQKVKFAGVYPLSVGIVDLDWQSKDMPVIFYVTLSYSYWERIS